MAIKDEAILLMRNRCYARALSLSITGMEEAGKALGFWLIGIGVVPESRRVDFVDTLLRNHQVKQALSLPLRIAGRVLPVIKLVCGAIPAARQRPVSWAEANGFLARMGPTLLTVGERIAQEALAEAPDFDRHVRRTLKGAIEVRRRSGLYTDLTGQTVLSPASITRAEAVDSIKSLRLSLASLEVMTRVAEFGDEGIHGLVAMSQTLEARWASSCAPRMEVVEESS
jgi:AbiV family abortive infection protein